jgi:hypothetical protein
MTLTGTFQITDKNTSCSGWRPWPVFNPNGAPTHHKHLRPGPSRARDSQCPAARHKLSRMRQQVSYGTNAVMTSCSSTALPGTAPAAGYLMRPKAGLCSYFKIALCCIGPMTKALVAGLGRGLGNLKTSIHLTTHNAMPARHTP